MTKTTKPVVVVTGGASGIGAATCEVLAGQGWTVVVADIAREAGEGVASQQFDRRRGLRQQRTIGKQARQFAGHLLAQRGFVAQPFQTGDTGQFGGG